MARHISSFMAGYVDQQSAPDWCEWINIETRCEASSHYDVCGGSSCSRWCAPISDAGRKLVGTGKNRSKKAHVIGSGQGDDGKKHQGYGRVEIQATGGWGGGGCCCTQPSAGGGQGVYLSECKRLYVGYYACTVSPHYGCCRTDIYGCTGCWALWADPNAAYMCAQGGWCGGSNCFSMYCCVDQAFSGSNSFWCTGNTCSDGSQNPTYAGPSDVPVNEGYHISRGAQIHTIYYKSCQQNIGNCFRCGQNSPNGHGRMPWLSSYGDFAGGNHIQLGSFCHQRKTTNTRGGLDGMTVETQLGEFCSAAAECQKTTHNPRGFDHGMGNHGWTARECFAGCIGENCGVKIVAGMGGKTGNFGGAMGWKVSGAAWEVAPFINSENTCGGWNRSQWRRCAWGIPSECSDNVRSVGQGGYPTAVCGQPCCCGGYPGPGAVMIRYR